MKNIMLAAAFLGLLTVSANAENVHAKPGHQSRTEAYEQGANKVKTEKPQPAATSTEGKRLPGRDCKFYEAGTRQHSFPQYEIGNPNRPECPSA